MMAPKITYNQAVDILDEYLHKKPNHATKAILQAMRSICNDAVWVVQEEQNDFANICANFDKYIEATGKTSIGRKQFEALWEQDFDFAKIDLPEDPLPDMFNPPKRPVDEAVEKLFGHFEGADNSREAYDLKTENTRLRNKVRELEAELKAANQKLENIRGIILWT